MDWNEITALCAAFGAMGTMFLFATRAIVQLEIRKLNGTYLRTELAKEKFQQVETHFDFLRDQIEPLRRECPLVHAEALKRQET